MFRGDGSSVRDWYPEGLWGLAGLAGLVGLVCIFRSGGSGANVNGRSIRPIFVIHSAGNLGSFALSLTSGIRLGSILRSRRYTKNLNVERGRKIGSSLG